MLQQTLIISGMLAGGLGLFMLAVSMITDGLKHAAGHALRDLLGKWTRSHGHGILSGLFITMIVQSSSAVTVAIIGFVNAGLINLRQALGVVYGSNIGTTMTAWLVAMVGFQFNIDAFALPMIGAGMLLHLSGGDSRRAPLGLALAGFGLFFIGIDVLREAFAGLVTMVDLQAYSPQGFSGVLLYLFIGFFMTLLTQSSSAAIAITLTAASGGVLDLHAAAATVIGANVGTTSTAAIAVIGATANARRVAAAHIVFNFITAAVALSTLPLLLWLVASSEQLLGLQTVPAVTLAIFHSTFNILGVLLMWPLSTLLLRFLEKRFVTREELESKPRYLDKTVSVSPLLAVDALALELSRMAGITRRMGLEALSSEFVHSKPLLSDHLVMHKLSTAVAAFIKQLERGVLSREISEQLAKVLRAEQHLLAAADQALEIARIQPTLATLSDEALIGGSAFYRAEVVRLMKIANPEEPAFSFAECQLQLDRVQTAYDDVKAALLLAAAELRAPIEGIIDIIEQNSLIRRMSRQMIKAMHLLNELSMVAEVRTPEVEKPVASTEPQQPAASETAEAAEQADAAAENSKAAGR